MRTRKTRTWLTVSASAAIALGFAAASAATASAARTHTHSSYQLTVQAPLFGQVGNAVPSFGSLEVKSGGSTWCYAPKISQVSVINAEEYLNAPYRVVEGRTYTLSAWEGPHCDAYIPAWGRRAMPVGRTVTTKVGKASPNAHRVGSTWHVVIPQA